MNFKKINFRKKLSFNKDESIKNLYLIVFIVFVFVFIVSALLSIYTPYSSRSTARYNLAPIYSNLQEKVTEIYVQEREDVVIGQPLFKLNDFKLKESLSDLENQYTQEVNKLKSLDQNILIAKEKIELEKQIVDNNEIQYKRYKISYKNNSVSKEVYQDKELTYKTSLNQLNISKLNLQSEINERGTHGEYNENLQSIISNMNQVKKDISDSVIKATRSGTVSLHNLSIGQMIDRNSSFGYIHDKSNLFVYVDYMEKSVVHMKSGDKALVAFDAIPGKLFEGTVRETTSLLSSGYNEPNKMENIEEISRWIRPSGRSRVKIIMDEELHDSANVTSGSRCSVTVLSDTNFILNFIAKTWMHISSFINYIY